MRRQRQTRLIGAVAMMALLAVVGATSRASADDETRKRKDVSLMIRKFVRGGLNIVTCWIEIPKNISVDWKTSDPFSATALGAAEGIWWATARFVGGFYEVFSFPFPYPDNYAPLIEPEFILTPIWGEPAPFMTDKPPSPTRSFE